MILENSLLQYVFYVFCNEVLHIFLYSHFVVSYNHFSFTSVADSNNTITTNENEVLLPTEVMTSKPHKHVIYVCVSVLVCKQILHMHWGHLLEL